LHPPLNIFLTPEVGTVRVPVSQKGREKDDEMVGGRGQLPADREGEGGGGVGLGKKKTCLHFPGGGKREEKIIRVKIRPPSKKGSYQFSWGNHKKGGGGGWQVSN